MGTSFPFRLIADCEKTATHNTKACSLLLPAAIHLEGETEGKTKLPRFYFAFFFVSVLTDQLIEEWSFILLTIITLFTSKGQNAMLL